MTDASSRTQALAQIAHPETNPLRRYSADGKRFLAWLASAILLVIFWQWYVTRFEVSPAIFPTPLAVWESLVVNIGDGTFISDLLITL